MTPLKRHLLGSTSPMVHDPVSVGAAIFSAAGAATVGTSAIIFGISAQAIVGYLAVSAVTSLALRALAPKPNVSGMQGMLTNGLDGTAPQHYVYGQVRKGGTVTFYEATGADNTFLHMNICLAGHEVQEIGDIYINDKVVTVNGGGFVTSAPWNSKIRIKKRLGSDTQVVDPYFDLETSADASFRGRGIAHLYVRLEYDQDVFTNGIPIITAVVKGKKVFDPRTGTIGWSSNAALCVRDYLVDARGLEDTGIDDTMLAVAANVCDENVPKATGGTEKRYAMNGVIVSDVQIGAALQQMMTACAGTLFWGQGEWKLKPAYYTPPVKTFTLNDLRSPITLQTRGSMSEVFNAVQGTFNDAAQDWVTVDYPKLVGSTFVAEDNGVESVIDVELPMTTSSATAQRISKLALFRGREQMTLSADFSLSALEVQVGDIIALTIDRYGWTAKEFEVVGWKFFNSTEGGEMMINMSLRETSEDAFDWDADERALAANNSNLPDPWSVPGIGITLPPVVSRLIYEKLTNVITVIITTDSGAYVERVEVQFKPSSDTEWRAVGVGSPGKFEIVDVGDGFYDIRARAYNQFGVRGEWQYQYNFQVSGLATPPEDVVGLHGYVSGGTVVLEWKPVGDLDLSHYTVRYAIEETGATFANATTAVEKVARPGSSVIVPARPGTYMVRAVDKTGVASPNYTSVVVTAAAFEQFVNNLSLTDSPTFTGSKTNCSVVSGQLRISSGLSGTYEFSNYIDTGAARRVRARTDVTLLRYDPTLGLFDALSGPFDSLPGLFDDFTGGTNYDDTDVVMYIRSTNTNPAPAASPVWSAWTIYKGGDFYGRAFQFRIDLVSKVAGVTPSITALTARVSYN